MQAQDAKNRLAEIRTERHLRLAQIAAPLDVDQSTIYRWEKGADIPRGKRAVLADLLGVDVPYLMGWTDEVAA